MEERPQPIKPGRPKLKVDNALIVHLRDVEHLGWSRSAEEYRQRTGQWISRDTFKRRYLEAKYKEELLQQVLEKIRWKEKH